MATKRKTRRRARGLRGPEQEQRLQHGFHHSEESASEAIRFAREGNCDEAMVSARDAIYYAGFAACRVGHIKESRAAIDKLIREANLALREVVDSCGKKPRPGSIPENACTLLENLSRLCKRKG